MEKIDEGKDKKHSTAKLTDNPEDGTPYITCSGMRLCSDSESIRGTSISGCQIEGQ